MPAIKCRKEGRKKQSIRKHVLLTWTPKHNVQILPQSVIETERYSVLSSYYNLISGGLQVVHYTAEHIFLMLLCSLLLRIYKFLAKTRPKCECWRPRSTLSILSICYTNRVTFICASCFTSQAALQDVHRSGPHLSSTGH
jgi:hypothetical protein